MQDLSSQKCVPCRGGIDPMKQEEAQELLQAIPEWELHENKIERTLTFKNFRQAMDFINNVADIAESEGHHPNISLFSWNKVKFTLFTHKINGLHMNDFILAAKINTALT